jgi:MarR family transcriptional regulator, organic hydroperoxide resistance regulator
MRHVVYDRIATLAQQVDRDLRTIREIVRRPLESELDKGQLTGPQKSAMAALVRSEGMTVKDLAVRLGLAHSTTSGIADRLEKQGLLERRQDEKDRRLTRLVVTGAVREFINKKMPGLAIHPLVEALNRAKPAERAAIINGLKTLLRVLETQR